MPTNRSPCLDIELLNAVANNSPHVIKFLKVMTLCNTVIPIKRLDIHPSDSFAHIFSSFLPFIFYSLPNAMASSPSGSILYKAQSQDEDALVNAAANLHMVLVSKNGNNAGRFSGS
jgi:phospholipid-translocating ATPase